MMRVFARNMATAAKINNVVVIGGGLMGSGIAQVSLEVPAYKKISIHSSSAASRSKGQRPCLQNDCLVIAYDYQPADEGLTDGC